MVKWEPQPRQKTSRLANSGRYGIGVAHFGHFMSTDQASRGKASDSRVAKITTS